MAYLSDSVMLDALKKVQEVQMEIVKKQFSAHLDIDVLSDWFNSAIQYITFDLTVFEGDTIIKSFDFSARDTEDVINATVALAEAYAKSL